MILSEISLMKQTWDDVNSNPNYFKGKFGLGKELKNL